MASTAVTLSACAHPANRRAVGEHDWAGAGMVGAGVGSPGSMHLVRVRGRLYPLCGIDGLNVCTQVPMAVNSDGRLRAMFGASAEIDGVTYVVAYACLDIIGTWRWSMDAGFRGWAPYPKP